MAEQGWHWTGLGPDAYTAIPRIGHDEAAARHLMNPGTAGDFPEVEQLQQERDTLRAEMASADADQRPHLGSA